MKNLIDISVNLSNDMPTWPGSAGFRLTPTMLLDDGDEANVSKLDCDIHVGTHIDAPWHFLNTGKTVDKIDLNELVGVCQVVHLPNIKTITAETLDKLQLDNDIKRLLFHTSNSKFWQNNIHDFQTEFVALTADAAKWIVKHNISLVGIDYLSIQHYNDTSETHEILLAAETIIIEGLNLHDVSTGKYELICLPLKILGAEGAPARAVLRPLT